MYLDSTTTKLGTLQVLNLSQQGSTDPNLLYHLLQVNYYYNNVLKYLKIDEQSNSCVGWDAHSLVESILEIMQYFLQNKVKLIFGLDADSLNFDKELKNYYLLEDVFVDLCLGCILVKKILHDEIYSIINVSDSLFLQKSTKKIALIDFYIFYLTQSFQKIKDTSLYDHWHSDIIWYFKTITNIDPTSEEYLSTVLAPVNLKMFKLYQNNLDTLYSKLCDEYNYEVVNHE